MPIGTTGDNTLVRYNGKNKLTYYSTDYIATQFSKVTEFLPFDTVHVFLLFFRKQVRPGRLNVS